MSMGQIHQKPGEKMNSPWANSFEPVTATYPKHYPLKNVKNPTWPQGASFCCLGIPSGAVQQITGLDPTVSLGRRSWRNHVMQICCTTYFILFKPCTWKTQDLSRTSNPTSSKGAWDLAMDSLNPAESWPRKLLNGRTASTERVSFQAQVSSSNKNIAGRTQKSIRRQPLPFLMSQPNKTNIKDAPFPTLTLCTGCPLNFGLLSNLVARPLVDSTLRTLSCPSL